MRKILPLVLIIAGCTTSKFEQITQLPWYGVGRHNPNLTGIFAENQAKDRAKLNYMRKRGSINLLNPESDYPRLCTYFKKEKVALCWNSYFLNHYK
jgi:hypothetical protein